MGDVAFALVSIGSYASPLPLSLPSQLIDRPQPWRPPREGIYSARFWQTLQLAPRTWPICRRPAHCHSFSSQPRPHVIKLRQKRPFNLARLQEARFLVRFRLWASLIDHDEEAGKHVDATSRPSNETQAPFDETPSQPARFVAAMPVPGNGSQRPAGDIAIALSNRKQTGNLGTKEQEADTPFAPQRSLEEEYGLLKEQVEADRRIQLANNQGSNAESITDTVKLLKRSKIIAKQVISQSSARVIGFVSQLWVGVRQFKLVSLEVRPSLLSGEMDRVFLADVCQIGDVVLLGDESALENEVAALDCETLVGYDVVTEDGNYLGKIRDYSFDLEDGKLTSLDFDSVGFSLVPSSLISTYRLDVEEVMELLPDAVLVKRGAECRIRRVTKGLWQLPNAGERRKSQKLARSRMQKRGSSEGAGINSQAKPLPSSMMPRYFEGTDSEGLDAQQESADRRSMRKDNGGSSRYRNR